MTKNKLLLLLALLLTAATGAWGMQIYISYPSWPTGTNVNGDGNLVLELEASDSFENVKAKINDKTDFEMELMHLFFNDAECADTETLAQKGVTANSVLTLVYGYTVALADGTEDADNWTATVGTSTTAQALPIGGLKGDGSETVTLQYNGRLKVKGVKATSDAAPAEAPAGKIVNPVLGQVIGSDGNNYDANATLPTGVTAVAKICYVGSETGEAAPYNHGLALALSDANEGIPCTWNTSYFDAGHTKQPVYTFTEESGLQYNATHNSDAYPAFQAAIANNGTAAPTGCSSWFLPSGYQWQKMADAVGGYTNLGLTPDAYYWSSSEYGDGEAWNFNSGEGIWYDSEKSYGDKVRACLAF